MADETITETCETYDEPLPARPPLIEREDIIELARVVEAVLFAAPEPQALPEGQAMLVLPPFGTRGSPRAGLSRWALPEVGRTAPHL